MPRRILALAGGQHLPENDFGNFFAGNLGTLQRRVQTGDRLGRVFRARSGLLIASMKRSLKPAAGRTAHPIPINSVETAEAGPGRSARRRSCGIVYC